MNESKGAPSSARRSRARRASRGLPHRPRADIRLLPARVRCSKGTWAGGAARSCRARETELRCVPAIASSTSGSSLVLAAAAVFVPEEFLGALLLLRLLFLFFWGSRVGGGAVAVVVVVEVEGGAPAALAAKKHREEASSSKRRGGGRRGREATLLLQFRLSSEGEATRLLTSDSRPEQVAPSPRQLPRRSAGRRRGNRRMVLPLFRR